MRLNLKLEEEISGDTHCQVLCLHLIVNELLISSLLLRDCDVGQGGFKI